MQAPFLEHPCYADAAIFTKAVRMALKFGEFYGDDNDGSLAAQALDAAETRISELASEGTPSWSRTSGLVVRGYVSPLDGSPQPYGLEIPAVAVADGAADAPLFVWLHGRGDTNTDLASIMGWSSKSAFPDSTYPTEKGVLVMHAFGMKSISFSTKSMISALFWTKVGPF